eukprot:2829474-Amphidinium_carterae.1
MCEITGNTIPQADADRWDEEEMKKAALWNYDVSLTDFSSAFLYAEFPEELRVLVTLPTTQPGATDDEGVRIPYLVLKPLYGLRVAPALWSKHLGSTLRKLGYRRSQLDPGVFWKQAVDGDGKEDPEKCYYIV